MGDARLTRRRGVELVSYLATTQHFDQKWLIAKCLAAKSIYALISVPGLMDGGC